jgi:hypothetical protein
MASFHWNARSPPSTPHIGTRPIFAHIAGMAVQVNPDLAFREEHQPRTRCSNTPPPNSNRTSSRDRLELSAPRSMNSAEGFSTFAFLDERAGALWSCTSRCNRERHP